MAVALVFDASDHFFCGGDHACDVGEDGGYDEGVILFGEVSELCDVLFGNAEVDGVCAALSVDGLGDFGDAFGGGDGVAASAGAARSIVKGRSDFLMASITAAYSRPKTG